MNSLGDSMLELTKEIGGLCQKCLQEDKEEREAVVSWREYKADHITPHSKGGKTEIENAQVLCRVHNRIKSGS